MNRPNGEAPRRAQGQGGDFVTVRMGQQLLGIPVLRVHDVLKPQAMTPVPRAPAIVAGVMNLRGRIVTAIDVRACLGLPPRAADEAPPMCVVIEHRSQPYALVVDGVGDVISVAGDSHEQNPATLNARWRQLATGVYRLPDALLIVIDVSALLDTEILAAA